MEGRLFAALDDTTSPGPAGPAGASSSSPEACFRATLHHFWHNWPEWPLQKRPWRHEEALWSDGSILGGPAELLEALEAPLGGSGGAPQTLWEALREPLGAFGKPWGPLGKPWEALYIGKLPINRTKRPLCLHKYTQQLKWAARGLKTTPNIHTPKKTV